MPSAVRFAALAIFLVFGWSQPGFAASQQSIERVQQLYVAYYGRPGDPGGVQFWAGRLDDSGGALDAIINDFGNSQEFVDRYGSLSDLDLIINLFVQMFNREPPADEPGVLFWLGRLQSGTSLARITTQIADGAQNEDFTSLLNKTQSAVLITDEIARQKRNYLADDIPAMRDALARVTFETDTDQIEAFALVAALSGGARTTISTTDGYPMQSITVLHPDIQEGAIVDVLFQQLVGDGETLTKGIAASDGRVDVPVPVNFNTLNGAIEAGAVSVSVFGDTATSALAVQALPSAPFTQPGLMTLGMLEFARRENQALRANLAQIVQESNAAPDATEELNAIDALLAALDAKILELNGSGGLTVSSSAGTTVLSGADLAQLDDYLLITLASLQTTADSEPASLLASGASAQSSLPAEPEFDGAASLRITSRAAGTRLDRILESWRRSFDALDNSDLDNEGARQAIGDLFRQTWEDTRTKGGEGVAKLTSYLGVVTGGIAALSAERNLAKAAAAYNLAAEQVSVVLGSMSAVLNQQNTDEFLAQRADEFDEVVEAISQFTRLGTNYLGNLPGEPGTVFGAINNAITLSDAVEAWTDEAQQALCFASSESLPFCDDVALVVNVTSDGGFSASSTFDTQTFAPGNAGDGSASTNWFSDGKGGGGGQNSEAFTWTSASDIELRRVEVDPETFDGGGKFGFAAVEVLVSNSGGVTVYSSGVIGLPGSRVNLNLRFPDGTFGNQVQLILSNHQDPDCGGLSEMRVYGVRD